MSKGSNSLERKLEEQSIPVALLPPVIPAQAEELAGRIKESLRDVLDPEAGVNVVELGLIQGVVIGEQVVEIQMKLTSGACPLADLLMGMVQRKAEEAIKDSPVGSVRVVLLNGNTNGQ